MRRILLTSLALTLVASVAFAQVGGSIGLFSDAAGADCNIADVAPGGLGSVYVVHVGSPGVTASEWAVSSPACILAPFLSDSSPFGVYIGASPFDPGKSVGYGSCTAAPVHVATLSYFFQGLTGSCCLQQIIPHMINGGPSAVDCAATKQSATGGGAVWNSDGTCDCDVAAHDASWGRIKALYEAP